MKIQSSKGSSYQTSSQATTQTFMSKCSSDLHKILDSPSAFREEGNEEGGGVARSQAIMKATGGVLTPIVEGLDFQAGSPSSSEEALY